jgi:CRP-like cAMP-binding protein
MSEFGIADRVTALRRVPLFSKLTRETITELARRAAAETAVAGTVLVEQGEPGSFLGILVSGRAEVARDGTRVSELGPGEHYGEMSLIDGGARSASIIALTDVEVLEVGAPDFRALLRIPHVAEAMLEGLSLRLREVLEQPPI